MALREAGHPDTEKIFVSFFNESHERVRVLRLGTVAVALNRPTENQLGDVLKRSGVTAEELAEGPRELHEAFGLRPLNLGGSESGDNDDGDG